MSDFFQVYADNIGEWLPLLLSAIPFTIQLTLVSFLLANVLGLAVAFAMLSRRKVLRTAAIGYVELMRGIPVLVVLYIVYFSLPSIGVSLGAFAAGVVAFGAYVGAQLAEVYRSAIRAVARGQVEAGQAVGFTRWAINLYLVLPQALTIALPALTNTLSALLKDTSLASIIAAPELTLQARDLATASFQAMHVYLLAAALYLVLSYLVALCGRVIEKFLGRGRATLAKRQKGIKHHATLGR